MKHSEDKNNIFNDNFGNSSFTENELFKTLQWSILQQEVIAEIIPLVSKDNALVPEIVQESLQKISSITKESTAIYELRRPKELFELKGKYIHESARSGPAIPIEISCSQEQNIIKEIRSCKVIQLMNNSQTSPVHIFFEQFLNASEDLWWIIPLKIKEKLYGLFVIHNPDINSINNLLFSFYKSIALVFAQAFDRVAVTAANKEMMNKLQKANQLKTAFLTNISHEVRTPVNSIVGFSDLLADPDLTVDQREEFINMITKSSRMLVKMFDNIIDASKLKSHQINFRNDWIDINLLLKEIDHDIKEKYDKLSDKVFFIVKPIDDNLQISLKTDSYRLKQVISKLTDNAIEHTNNGSIELSAIHKDKKLIFYVQDSGKGINKEHQQEIFSLFESEKEAFTFDSGGSGLGLSIAKEMIEQMGGSMWFNSEVDKGTTFYIAFNKHRFKIKEKQTDHKSDTQKDWSNYTILIAEDVEFNYIFLREIIAPTGANVLWAKNGVEACQNVDDNNNIDIILMDLQMPEMNGYEAAEYIKKHYPHISIIAQTAFMMANEDEKCHQIGCDGFLSKPIRPKQLIQAIKAII